MDNDQVEISDYGDDFEDQTRRRRHDHTVDKRVLSAPGGKHYVDDNGVLQQPAPTKWQALFEPSRHIHLSRSLAARSRLFGGILHRVCDIGFRAIP